MLAAVIVRVDLAFSAAIAEYGIPCEVRTDNGKQSIGRSGKPRRTEALFEGICREMG